ncbi:MAG: SDR family NAD(P)-dependent oxidoreductase [Alphaproteobacteria bacterium]
MASTALITGASSGIGESFAKLMAAKGHDLILVARREEQLQALATDLKSAHDIKVHVWPADLTDPQAAIALRDRAEEEGIVVELLINNAGVIDTGPFVNRPASKIMQVVDLNVAALTRLLHVFVTDMVERGQGKVLNVASAAAFQPTPGFCTYGATKAYVLSLTEGLSEELRGSGVTISALCPGVVKTPLLDIAAESSDILNQVPDAALLDADEVASQGYNAMMKGEVVSIAGFAYAAAELLQRAWPRSLKRRAAGLMTRFS